MVAIINSPPQKSTCRDGCHWQLIPKNSTRNITLLMNFLHGSSSRFEYKDFGCWDPSASNKLWEQGNQIQLINCEMLCTSNLLERHQKLEYCTKMSIRSIYLELYNFVTSWLFWTEKIECCSLKVRAYFHVPVVSLKQSRVHLYRP